MFDTVNHQILIKKLNIYGVKGKSLSFFENYLSERKHASVGKQMTFLQDIRCVSQMPIFGSFVVSAIYK